MQLKSSQFRRLIPLVLPVALAPFVSAAPLFEDNFDTDSSANWTVKTGYFEGSNPDDFSVDWAFDYSQLKVKVYKFAGDAEPVEFSIPPAPSSTGSTKGIRVNINKKDDLAERMAVNLYPRASRSPAISCSSSTSFSPTAPTQTMASAPPNTRSPVSIMAANS